MDGRDRIRRYLEQRRDAGERELLLDTMTVDEVMRIVAALPADRKTAAVGEPSAEGDPVAGASEPAPADAGDWRSILASAVGDVPLIRPVEPLADTTLPSSRPGAPTSPPTRGAPGATGQFASETVVPPRPNPPGAGVASTQASAPATQWPVGLMFGRAGADLFGGPLGAYRTLEEVAHAVADCTACPLYGTATQSVPGEGSPTASLVCVGEAPGATEDETGRPFVGAAGKLLDKILAAINLDREDVFICNVLKHRPPGNRNPLPAEVAACTPFLVRQLEIIRPRVILAFGAFAAQTLLETTQPIGKLRGAVHRYYGVPLIATYHPAALLRNPAWKRPTWEDVQYARRILNGTGV